MMKRVKISRDDLGALIIATVRYALGRGSYFPSIAIRLVQKYWNCLSNKDRKVVVEDIDEYLRRKSGSKPREDRARLEWKILREILTNAACQGETQ